VEEPVVGQVAVGGYPIERLSREALRRQFGVVPQNARHITGSIAENILFGSMSAGVDAAWKAAEQVGLADFIKRLPMGMQTVVSDGAATFSGGERQRIMLARAMVSNPAVLILDEATSALDNVSQQIVMDTLLASGATRIVVAHRLSTIVSADVIHVLVDGKIVESGNYQELMAHGDHFPMLVRPQLVD
jgi:ATP-binding cassette subfamily C protein